MNNIDKKDLDWLDQFRLIYPNEITDYLNLYIGAQKDLVSLLSHIGYMYSMQRLALLHGIRKSSLPKLNLLLTGPTGSGKTYSIEKFSQATKLEYMRIDCTSVSAEGWHGTNLTSFLEEYLNRCPSGFGILHFDEIDKIGYHRNSGTGIAEANKSLQMNLLDLLDGKFDFVEDKYGKLKGKHVNYSAINNSLILMTGSFQETRNNDKKEATKFNKGAIGFHSQTENLTNTQTWKQRLIDLGFIHELVGRIVTSYELKAYTREEITEIVKSGPESAYKRYLNLLGSDKALTDSELEGIIDKVVDNENGLRDLEAVIFDIYFNKRVNY